MRARVSSSAFLGFVLTCAAPALMSQQPGRLTLKEVRALGTERSSYGKQLPEGRDSEAPRLRPDEFRKEIQPVLKKACVRCHGPRRQKGNVRIDALNPDLLHGDDVQHWVEVLGVLTNGEMPPAGSVELADDARSAVVEWLAAELQVASSMRRAERGHSSFRRMTRYEYRYALQDLLGLPYDFARDLPPDPDSEDGFQNSSELLHMSPVQLEIYRESARRALRRATVDGERPRSLSWNVSMSAASAIEWARQDGELDKLREKHRDDPEKGERELARLNARFRARPRATHYENLSNGRIARPSWSYGNARYALRPTDERSATPAASACVAFIPPGQHLIVELGDRIPDEGMLRVRVRAARASGADTSTPSLQLYFGWQASNDSHASVRISAEDLVIDGAPDQARYHEWRVPLGEVHPRNSVRRISKMGDLPSPSEYIKLVNSSAAHGTVRIEHVEVTAPFIDRWPPASHARIFGESAAEADESDRAREVLERFMPRAWRRPITPAEVERKLALFAALRPACDDFRAAVVETLASVISSPNFLYVIRSAPRDREGEGKAKGRLSDLELATRLSMFLWCSSPDEALLASATSGELSAPEALDGQVDRMLSDPRSQRFARHFVRQWLDMKLLDFYKVDHKAYPQFAPSLKEAMGQEPVAFFQEILRNDLSILEFIHSDFAMVNERLARHYGLAGVAGNHFRRVPLPSAHRRGGLLTQAGLLAMNSDGKDSHPLKRGIWLLESLLDDPPPPPPPAVPEIDLADPEIAKMTLKERIQHHRDQEACMSCHAKIDPWGIAFENYDAVGSWRTQVQGRPVDASSVLFNDQELAGMDGLKRFLLEFRQDQFARAVVRKMTTFALGRPLTFADRASIDRITAALRREGDGLATLVRLIATSEMFRTR